MRHETIHLKDTWPVLGEKGRDPLLYTYLPYNMTEMHREHQRRPCILLCPGGGYIMVSQREEEPLALKFLPEGYNVFILHYSVAPHRFPVQLQEVAAAVELIYARAEEWNCDTGRLAIMGFSAGGHLAAHYSNRYDCPEVRALFPDSKPVRASILGYPVITADPDYTHLQSVQDLSGHMTLTEQDIAAFSCERLVTDRTPPAFLWHTAEDQHVPVMNSLLYAQALARHGIPFALHIYPHGLHGLSTVDLQSNDAVSEAAAPAADWVDAAKKWLKVTL